MGKNSSRFYQNLDCQYFPCHEGVSPDSFNCLFCYCPLYMLGPDCGGTFEVLDNGFKSCMGCTFPHEADHYEAMTAAVCQVLRLTSQTCLARRKADTADNGQEIAPQQ